MSHYCLPPSSLYAGKKIHMFWQVLVCSRIQCTMVTTTNNTWRVPRCLQQPNQSVELHVSHHLNLLLLWNLQFIIYFLPCFLWCSFIGYFDIFFPFWMLPFCPMIENQVSKVFHPFPHQTKQACYQNYHKNYMRLSCYLCFFTVKS